MSLNKEKLIFKQMANDVDEPFPIVINKSNCFSLNSYAKMLPRVYEPLESC